MSAPAPTSTDAARHVVADVTGRLLADATAIAAKADMGLVDGPLALALLLTEVGGHDVESRRQAHALLASVASRPVQPDGGLYAGVTALAFATEAASGGVAYRAFLAEVDRHVCELAHRLTAMTRAERAAAGFWLRYDVITGLSGIARYLLRRRGHDGVDDVLAGCLRALAGLATPHVVDGIELPGWWVDHGLIPIDPRPGDDEAHANIGAAHGIAGPLSVLSLAWLAGVRIQGLDDVIVYLAEWLCRWSDRDEAGPCWSTHLNRAALAYPEHPRHRFRTAWCYGTPGVARSLQLAGQALGESSWERLANVAMRAELSMEPYRWRMSDASLCHGTAGVLHLCRLMARDYPAEGFDVAAQRMAGLTVAAFDPSARYGFTFVAPDRPTREDRSGFLDGAAGVALALDAYVHDATPRTGWDAAFCVV